MTIKVFGQKRVGQQQQLLQLTFPLFIEPLLPYVQHLNKLEAARQAIKSSFLQKSNGQSVSNGERLSHSAQEYTFLSCERWELVLVCKA